MHLGLLRKRDLSQLDEKKRDLLKKKIKMQMKSRLISLAFIIQVRNFSTTISSDPGGFQISFKLNDRKYFVLFIGLPYYCTYISIS